MDNLTGRIGFIPVYETLPDAKDFNEGMIIIDYSQDNPELKYSEIMGNDVVWVNIDGSDSPIIPASMSDLEDQLRQRDWNITERIYSDVIYSKPEIVLTTTPSPQTTTTTKYPESPTTSSTPLPSSRSKEVFTSNYLVRGSSSNPSEKMFISRQSSLEEIPEFSELTGNFNPILVSDDDFNQTEANEFCNIYEELINLKMKILEKVGESEVDLGTRQYYNVISIRDVERGSSTVDLISLGGSKYTNIINLNDSINLDFLDLRNGSCILTVGIEFTVSGKTYSKECNFTPYVIEDEVIVSNSFITNILDYVSMDFHKNCLRVFPISKKVTECIISYCYIDYEGLF